MVDTIFLIYNRCFTNCGYMKAIYFRQDLPLNESETIPVGRFHRFRRGSFHFSGSIGCPFLWTRKSRCGPVESPVEPT